MHGPLSTLFKTFTIISDRYKSMDLAIRDPKAFQSIAGRPLRGYTHPIRCESLHTPPKLR